MVATRIEDTPYAVLRCVGLARSELDYALAFGVGKLVAALKHADLYPTTVTKRRPVVQTHQ